MRDERTAREGARAQRRSSGRPAALFGPLVAVLVAAAPARAQDAAPAPGPASAPVKPWGPRLEYSSAPGCLDEESFRHAVAGFVDSGADPFDPGAPDVLRVRFEKIAGGYRGTTQYTPPKGDPWPAEQMTGATCSEVFRDVARLARMRVPDPPKAAPAPPAPAPPAPAPPAPAPAPEPSPPPPDPVASQAPRVAPTSFGELRFQPPPPPPPMDLTVTLSTALVLTAGFTNNVGPALQVGGGLRYDWFSLDLELRGVFPGIAWATEPVPLEDSSRVPRARARRPAARCPSRCTSPRRSAATVSQHRSHGTRPRGTDRAPRKARSHRA